MGLSWCQVWKGLRVRAAVRCFSTNCGSLMVVLRLRASGRGFATNGDFLNEPSRNQDPPFVEKTRPEALTLKTTIQRTTVCRETANSSSDPQTFPDLTP